MKVRVRYHDLIAQTPKAILLLISEEKVWLPKAALRFRDNHVIMPEALAEEKKLKWKPLRHVPAPIKPERRDVIDELKYEA